MVWLTWNPASALHAASADLDQSNALLQRPLPTKFSITVTTVYTQRYNRSHWQQSCLLLAGCGRLSVHARFRRSPAASAGASPLCWRSPNKPMLMTPAEARREAQSTRQARRRRPKQSKTLKLEVQKSPPNLNRSPKCSSRTKEQIEARSACQSQKRLSK